MLDIKLIRNEPEKVRKALEKRKEKIDLGEVLDLDKRRREILYEVEQLKNMQNTISKQIPSLKKEGKDISELLEKMKELSGKIKDRCKS